MAVLALVFLGGFVLRLPAPDALQKLEYDGVQVFQVGVYKVTIETQSAAVSRQDKGPAQIVVLTGAGRVTLESWFDRDNWMDVRPAYITRAEFDEHRGPDLLIWQPSGASEVTATAYISSAEGQLHMLAIPLKRETDLSATFFGN